MKKEKRYNFTKIRDKRSIVRAMNTFKKQASFILCDSNEIDLNIEPMVLYYQDEITQFDKSNIVYSMDEVNIYLRDTELILDTIDNLLSINTKNKLKQELKKLVKSRVLNGLNVFLTNEKLSIIQINSIVDNEPYSKRLFNQIKNRILFFRSGVYSTQYAKSKVIKGSKVITTNPTSHIKILEKKLNYVLKNKYLLEDEIVEKYDELQRQYDKYTNDENFNQEFIPTEHNTSLYHPIDESEYSDEENNDNVRESNMTEAMIAHGEYGFYDKEFFDEYALYEDYKSIVNELKKFAEDLIDYIYYAQILKENIISKYQNKDYVLEIFKQCDKSRQVFERKELWIELQQNTHDCELIKSYFTNKNILDKINENKNILESISNGDTFIISEEEYEDLIYFQDNLLVAFDYTYEVLQLQDINSIYTYYDYYNIDYDLEEDDELQRLIEFDRTQYIYCTDEIINNFRILNMCIEYNKIENNTGKILYILENGFDLGIMDLIDDDVIIEVLNACPNMFNEIPKDRIPKDKIPKDKIPNQIKEPVKKLIPIF